MIIGEFASNVDVYAFSTFFHKDRKGKLRAGPVWDYNLTYGHDEFGNRSRYDVWQFDNDDNNGPKFWKDLFETIAFRCYFAKRWFEVTAEGMPLNYNQISARMDELDQLIAEAVVRDNQRWGYMNQHAYEVQAMKTWIQQRINWLNNNIMSFNNCYAELPPLVISRINYHPLPNDTIDGDNYEFIQINNNGDDDVDLTGIYFRKLGVTYRFPNGSTLAARDSLVLCSDSLRFMERYNRVPFGQYMRKLSNNSEDVVIADAWGNIIDEVHYADTLPWPIEADGQGAYLQLIDLNLDNNLPESWIAAYEYDNTAEIIENQISVYPNPSNGILKIDSNETVISVEVYDMAGRKLAAFNNDRIDISDLPNGFYSLRIVTGKAVSIEKIALIK